MEMHVTIRSWLLGAAGVLLLAGAGWSVIFYRDLASRDCPDCQGFQSYQVGVGSRMVCRWCEGSGKALTTAEIGNKLLVTILSARRELLWCVSSYPWEFALSTGGLLSLGFLAGMVRVVPCRRCSGSGRTKSVRSPRIDCAVCEGRGRATLIDQLVSKA